VDKIQPAFWEKLIAIVMLAGIAGFGVSNLCWLQQHIVETRSKGTSRNGGKVRGVEISGGTGQSTEEGTQGAGATNGFADYLGLDNSAFHCGSGRSVRDNFQPPLQRKNIFSAESESKHQPRSAVSVAINLQRPKFFNDFGWTECGVDSF